MKNYPKPTEKDVARLIEGMIADPWHEHQILEAIGNDDQLQAYFDLLTSDVDFTESTDDQSDDDLRAFVSATVQRIAKTRLLGIAWHTAPVKMSAGHSAPGDVIAFDSSPRGQTAIPIELDASQISAGRISVSLGKISVDLVNLTVVDLGFAANRPLLVRQTLHPNFGDSVVGAWKAARRNRTVRLRGAEVPVHERHVTSLAAHSARGLDRILKLESNEHQDRINITCTGDSTREFELVVVETKYPSDQPGFEAGVIVAKPVILVREDEAEPGANFQLNGFQLELPTEASGFRDVEVTVRPAQPADLRLLSLDQISTLLGQSQPRCLPLVKDSLDRLSIRLDSDELKMLTEPRFTWCVGVIPTEGTRAEGSIHASL